MECGTCIHRKVCGHTEHYSLFTRELEETKKDYNLPVLTIEIHCKEFKEEEF